MSSNFKSPDEYTYAKTILWNMIQKVCNDTNDYVDTFKLLVQTYLDISREYDEQQNQ